MEEPKTRRPGLKVIVEFWERKQVWTKAREMTQHGGPPGWLEVSDPAG